MPQKRHAKQAKSYAEAVESRLSKKQAKQPSTSRPAHDLLTRIMTSVLPYVSDDYHYIDMTKNWAACFDRFAEVAVIYDDKHPDGTKHPAPTDFYARVECSDNGFTTVVVDWTFVPRELLVDKDDLTFIKVRDPKNASVRDELHFTKDDGTLVYTTANRMSVTKNVRMLLGTLYSHAQRMQPPVDPNWDAEVYTPPEWLQRILDKHGSD